MLYLLAKLDRSAHSRVEVWARRARGGRLGHVWGNKDVDVFFLSPRSLHERKQCAFLCQCTSTDDASMSTHARAYAGARAHTRTHIYLATTHECRDLHVIVQHYERIEPEGPHTGLHTMVCTTQPFLIRSPLPPPAPPPCRFSVLPKPPIFGISCVTFNPVSISILPSVAPHERGQRFHVFGVGRV